MMESEEPVTRLVAHILSAYPDRLSPLGAGLVASAYLGVGTDSRSFARTMDLAHALVVRECTILSDDQGLLAITFRDPRSQGVTYRLTEAAQEMLAEMV